MSALVMTTLGVGAAESPRFAPAGLLVKHEAAVVMLDGGPGCEPRERLDAWLVTDEHAELMSQIKRIAGRRALEPRIGDFAAHDLAVLFRPVVHTNHLSGGYLIKAHGMTVVWAPEFWEFPAWAANADLMFAEASGWNRRIRFAGGVGGHMDVMSVAAAARTNRVARLVFAHIGRPALKAIDRGERPPFGEFATDGQVFRLVSRTSTTARPESLAGRGG